MTRPTSRAVLDHAETAADRLHAFATNQAEALSPPPQGEADKAFGGRQQEGESQAQHPRLGDALAMIRGGCSFAEAEEVTGAPWKEIKAAWDRRGEP